MVADTRTSPKPLNAMATPSSFAGAIAARCEERSCTERIPSQDAQGHIGAYEVDAGPLESSPACIFVIESGKLCVSRESGQGYSFGAGAMLLCLGERAPRAFWERARFSHVQPSPQRLAQLLDRVAGVRLQAFEPLHHHGLAPFLASQLDMLKTRRAMLAPTELQHVFEGIFQTVEALLKGAFPLPAHDDAALVPDRLRAVHRFMQRNLHRPDLSVSDVAIGANISRASLYRLFDTQAHSVHGTLREERLQKGLSYLEAARGDRLSIGAIAHACGFSDQAVFSKQFRQRFGITPRQARSSSLMPMTPMMPMTQEPQGEEHQFR